MSKIRSHKEIEKLKRQKPPLCACGCERPVNWNTGKNCWRTYINGHFNRIKREIRTCACGCKQTFKCKINSKQKFISHHFDFKNTKTEERRLQALLEKTSGEKHWKWIKKENRICKCGCNKQFQCKITSKQKYIHGHNSRTKEARRRKRKQIKQQRKNSTFIESQRKSARNRRGANHPNWMPLELRICECGCGKTFECKVWSKKRFLNRKHCPTKQLHTVESIKKSADAQRGRPRPSIAGKNHYRYGKHLSKETKDKIRKGLKKWREQNPEKVRKNVKNMIKYCQKHRKEHSQYLKRYYQEHPEKIEQMQQRIKRYYQEHPEARLLGKNNPNWKGGKEINYIKRLLCEKFNLKRENIPQELIELKREHLKLGRLLKGIKNESSETSTNSKRTIKRVS